MDRLKGKRALITGGTTGIGLETARQFLAEGARVAMTGTNPATIEAARKELGEQTVVFSSDASDVAAPKKLAGRVRQAFGGLDVLVINAGIADLRPLEQWDEAGFDRTFSLNVKGPLFLVQSLLPVFANPASIVLTSSVNAHIGMANTSAPSIMSQVPAGRFGDPKEVAKAIVFLASEEAPFTVGGELLMDGGLSL